MHQKSYFWNRFPTQRVNKLISSYIMFIFKTNEPIKVIHLLKLANQSVLKDALVIEIVNNSFNESKKNFLRLIY